MIKNLLTLACCSIFSVCISVKAQERKKIVVQANKPGAEIQPFMWGVFFEDINFGADGGLYAELVKNRSFEFATPMMGWKEIKPEGAVGKTLIINSGDEKPSNPRFARITVNSTNGVYGLSNEGFRGMGIHKEQPYIFSAFAKKQEGNVTIRVELVNRSGKKLGTAVVQDLTDRWEKHIVSLNSTDTASKAILNVLFEGTGTIDVDMISLFPHNTWKNRPNGLRKDLVQMLADLNPGFIRFPGGCIVEGKDLANRYQWKKTVGLVEERNLIMNRWNVEFAHRAAPDYFQTFGLGFFEYFQLCEDIGAEPLPILNCGMACQFNTGEVAGLDQLDPYIQDALDLIEFANGSEDTQWGKVRKEMGHPLPFKLKFLGIGNEQWDEQYIERYKEFEKALKQTYPDIKLIASAGPFPDGARFSYAWKEFTKTRADLIDEHYYQSPDWFLKNVTRYDSYDRNGPKVFAGEYAAHAKEGKEAESRNTWLSALSEAAFMTGLERNAAVVQMASYAPLFAHVEAWQWRPDLIWFDNLRTVATPNYYVQQLFSVHKGTHVIPILSNSTPLTGTDSLYASATIDKNKGTALIKLVNTSGVNRDIDLKLEGRTIGKNGTVTTLTSTDVYVYNSIENQKAIYPVNKTVGAKKNTLLLTLEPYSLNVLSIPLAK